MKQAPSTTNRLTPWCIGVAIVLASVTFSGYKMWTGNYSEIAIPVLGVLTIIPTVYLVLMYPTFISQE